MRRTLGLLTVAVLLTTAALAVNGNKAQYDGGTENQVRAKAQGTVSTTSAVNFVFTSDHGSITVPYADVNDLEYGQKAGRRVGLAIMVTPLALFSKKRKHFLTIGWKDAHNQQHVAVFELGKHIVRVTLATLEARTGRKVEYQDDEARKSGMGGE